MGDVGAEEGKSSDAGEQIEQQDDRDEILRRDRNRNKHQGEFRIGIEHAKRHEHAVDRAGRAEHQTRQSISSSLTARSEKEHYEPDFEESPNSAIRPTVAEATLPSLFDLISTANSPLNANFHR